MAAAQKTLSHVESKQPTVAQEPLALSLTFPPLAAGPLLPSFPSLPKEVGGIGSHSDWSSSLCAAFSEGRVDWIPCQHLCMFFDPS